MQIVAIMGSYRRGGALDSSVRAVLAGVRERGVSVEQIDLIDRDIGYCTNCRACLEIPGLERGRCVHDDDLEEILARLDAADGLVLGAPVNLGDVNALTRTLLERMVGYASWPPGAEAPRMRRRPSRRPAVLVTSSAAPAILTRTCARPLRTLGQMAKLLGARPSGTLVVGRAGGRDFTLGARKRRRARALGRGLVALAARREGRVSRSNLGAG